MTRSISHLVNFKSCFGKLTSNTVRLQMTKYFIVIAKFGTGYLPTNAQHTRGKPPVELWKVIKKWRNFPYTASGSVYLKVNKNVNISLQRVRVFAGTLRCKRQSSRPITFAPGVVKNILLDTRSQHASRVSG